MAFHAIYSPASPLEPADRILTLVETDRADEVRLLLRANPDAIGMELEADCLSDAHAELAELGFYE
jgi:hypothetical protein